MVTTLNFGEPCMFEMLCKIWRIEKHRLVLNHYVVNDLFNVCSCVCRKYRDNIEWVWSESCKYGLIRHRLQIFFFVTIFISFFTCTCYRYKTFIQYQKKKERKEKHPAKEKIGEFRFSLSQRQVEHKHSFFMIWIFKGSTSSPYNSL